jgi:protein HIRA/HIR1
MKAYNPHIFLRTPSAPITTSNICSVVALGADDRSVSVWQTKSARPLIVAREVFERQIMDLSWCVPHAYNTSFDHEGDAQGHGMA